jgi:exonuclease VII small subunit
LREQLISLNPAFKNLPLKMTEENVKRLKEGFASLEQDGLNKVNIALEEAEQAYSEYSDSMEKVDSKLASSKDEVVDLDSKMSDASAIITRIKAFVGLQGAVEIFRRAIANAF